MLLLDTPFDDLENILTDYFWLRKDLTRDWELLLKLYMESYYRNQNPTLFQHQLLITIEHAMRDTNHTYVPDCPEISGDLLAKHEYQKELVLMDVYERLSDSFYNLLEFLRIEEEFLIDACMCNGFVKLNVERYINVH